MRSTDPFNFSQFNQESLLSQSLDKKVKLCRSLRQLIKEYVNWMGGEALLSMSAAIASLESEIDELTAEDAPIGEIEGMSVSDFQLSQLAMRRILEDESAEPLQKVEAARVLRRSIERQACPMQHQCPAAPCAHRWLCDDAKSAGID